MQSADRLTKQFQAGSLTDQINPNTRRRYTDPEIAEKVGIHPETVGRIRRQGGVIRFPPPQVLRGKLTTNEEAFYRGLVRKNFQVKEINWGFRKPPLKYVVVISQSSQERRNQLLRETLGSKGEVHPNRGKLRVYMDRRRFGFLLNRVNLPDDYLAEESRYSPFVAALLAVNMSLKHSRFTLNNDLVLFDEIHERFKDFFGISMGRIHDTEKGKFIIVSPDVIPAIASSAAVNTLPFFSNHRNDSTKGRKLTAGEYEAFVAEMNGVNLPIPRWLDPSGRFSS